VELTRRYVASYLGHRLPDQANIVKGLGVHGSRVSIRSRIRDHE
jgi:hypothetical protein